MKNLISEITKLSDNLELMASLVASVGMIILMINFVAGKIIIILGITGLAFLYIVQCLPFLSRGNGGKKMLKLTLHHLSSIVVLTGMLLAMMNSRFDLAVLSVGWILMAGCLLSDIIGKHRSDRYQLGIISLRFFVLSVISIIFYFGF